MGTHHCVPLLLPPAPASALRSALRQFDIANRAAAVPVSSRATAQNRAIAPQATLPPAPRPHRQLPRANWAAKDEAAPAGSAPLAPLPVESAHDKGSAPSRYRCAPLNL